eukprot:gene15494-biopygen18716
MACRGCHFGAFLEHFWSIFGAFLEPKTTKITSKHAPQRRIYARPLQAPQRRVYARSVQKGPIDGTHGCPQKTVFSVPSGEPVRPSARPKDAFFRTFGPRILPGVQLALSPCND